jgi:hypothetical protein
MSKERFTPIPQVFDPRRKWETMRLTSVGRVGDLMQGTTGSKSDTGGSGKHSGT